MTEISESLRSLYAQVMTRCAQGDLDAHIARVKAAQSLATQAFVDKDKTAWQLAKLAEFRLQKKSNLRPTEPGDVHVISELYRIESAQIPQAKLPPGLSAKQFVEYLSEQAVNWSGYESDILRHINSGDFSDEEMRYITYQCLPVAGEFMQLLCAAMPRFSNADAVVLSENLWDEAGEGKVEDSHIQLFHDFATHFGADTNLDTVLEWAHPESIDGVTMTHRHLWQYDPAYTLGSVFVIEASLARDLPLFVEGCSKRFEPDVYKWWTIHAGADVEHSEDLARLLEAHLGTPEAQQTALQAASERGNQIREFWGTMFANMREWQKTGTPTRLPDRELRAAS